jgi:hypothetical protein
MTNDEFRRVALAIEGTSESAHMGHPDFRANGKIFATLHYPDDRWGMVKLPPELQNEFLSLHPNAFRACNGAWGRQGSTNVLLAEVQETVLREALHAAVRATTSGNKAAKKPVKRTAPRRRKSI